MDRSCRGIFLDWDRPAFERDVAALLDANDKPEAALRLVMTRGGRRISIIEPLPAVEHGLALSSVAYEPTVVLTGLKTLSYAANMNATRLARKDGADEALLVRPDGTVLEAPTSTIFWVDGGGELCTPEVETGVLASITRDRVMKALPVHESDSYRLKDVLDASEVFIASSLREIQGVASLDELTYECPGPVTQRVAGMLTELIQAELAAEA
jgi:branched-chain amino acid aminotransferase